MNASDIQVRVERFIPRPPEEVFDTIVSPALMSQYFISNADGPMVEGKTIRWTFSDVGAEVEVVVRRVVRDELVAFEWAASGASTQVEIMLEPEEVAGTLVRVTEAGWSMDQDGVAKALEQTQGWTDFLCCLKAYLVFGINLRRGDRAGDASQPARAANEAIVLDFLRIALVDGQPGKAVEQYVAPNFRQHNPAVADGPQALAESIAKVVKENPSALWEPKRTVAAGDLVVVHGHRRFNAEDRGAAVVNILRLAEGKIVEQWTVGQPVPESTANQNGMF